MSEITNDELSKDRMDAINRQIQDILQISGQNEVLQSFVRNDITELEEDVDRERVKEKKMTSFKLKSFSASEDGLRSKQLSGSTDAKTRRMSSGANLYHQIVKDYSLVDGKNKSGKWVKQQQKQMEEIYTDKDRAAAVNLGSKDIKHSLRLKRQQDRSRILEISEEAHPGTLLALGNHELRNKDVKVAITFVNKALELNPYDKNALVARSKCHLLLGEAKFALKDAEKALGEDKTFVKGIFQKAEALYHLGKFEHSLMYFHRGLHLRPEMEDFRLGVQKSQQAIENIIGKSGKYLFPRQKIKNKNSVNISNEINKIPMNTKIQPKRLLGQLQVDKDYLESLLKNPDIESANGNDKIKEEVREGVQFLENRQEFWRQQQPLTAKKSCPRKIRQ